MSKNHFSEPFAKRRFFLAIKNRSARSKKSRDKRAAVAALLQLFFSHSSVKRRLIFHMNMAGIEGFLHRFQPLLARFSAYVTAF